MWTNLNRQTLSMLNRRRWKCHDWRRRGLGEGEICFSNSYFYNLVLTLPDGRRGWLMRCTLYCHYHRLDKDVYGYGQGCWKGCILSSTVLYSDTFLFYRGYCYHPPPQLSPADCKAKLSTQSLSYSHENRFLRFSIRYRKNSNGWTRG